MLLQAVADKNARFSEFIAIFTSTNNINHKPNQAISCSSCYILGLIFINKLNTMKKLISMTDFVYYIGNNENHVSFEKDLSKIYKYNMFLRQELNLSMFITCDDDGKILVKPEYFEKWLLSHKLYMPEKWYKDCEEYKKAKEKVLFEGFEFGTYPLENYILHKSGWGIPLKNISVDTIEFYANERYNLQLTETALKQLELLSP